MTHLYVKFGDPSCIAFLRYRLDKLTPMKTLPRHCRLHLLFYHRLPMPPAFITFEAPPQIGSYILTRVCLFVCLLPRMLVWVAYHEIWGIGINKGPEKT